MLLFSLMTHIYSMLFINSKTIPVSNCYYIPRRMKAEIRPFDFHFFHEQVCACLTFPLFGCLFLIRQQQKGRSQKNVIPWLASKIKVDRYNGVKEKHVHTDVVIEFRELFMVLFMQLKIGIYIGVFFGLVLGFLFVSFVFTCRQRWHLQNTSFSLT